MKINVKLIKEAVLVLRAVNHPIRQRILNFTAKEPKTVTQIYKGLNLEQSVASQHLAIMRRKNIMIAERVGKNIFYRPNPEAIKAIETHCEGLTDF